MENFKKKNETTTALTHGTLYYQRTRANLINPSINRSRPYYIYLIYDQYHELVNFTKYLLTLIAIFFIGILALTVATYLIQRRVLTLPLTAINNAIKNHDAETKSNPIIHKSNDELGRLVTSYNTVIAELENHAERLKIKSKDLTLAKEKAEEATLAKSQFLACMSHEIRTPMNGVLGMLTLLENTQLNTDQQHKARLIRTSSESLLCLINDILDFSKIEAGKMQLYFINFNLLELLSDFTETIAYRAKEKNVELILDVWQVKHTQLNGDPDRLRQIISNLVSNAIKFTEEGEIIIHVETRVLTEGKVTICFAISDTGIGIPQEKIPFLFDSFTQVDSSTTRQFGGTGLGLAITKNLCELMDGDIRVNSRLNRGSCFEATLTLNYIESQSSVPAASICADKSIVVADPNLSSNTAVCNFLGNRGAIVESITEQSNFFNKIEDFFQKRPSGIVIIAYGFLDKKTPEAIKSIRDKLADKTIKFIFMTELQSAEKPIDFKHLCFNAIFEKPATPNNLLRAIEQAEFSPSFKQKESTTQLETPPSQPANHKKTNILVVEDNDVNQAVLQGLLEEIGQIPDIAGNGAEALRLLQHSANSKVYDLILMDCQMPIMDGYATTIAVRSDPRFTHYREIPIIALTANAMNGDREKCLETGMSDYLSKPIAPEILYEKIRYWCAGRDSESLKPPSHQPFEISPTEKTLVWDKKSALRRMGNKEHRLRKLTTKFLNGLPELLQGLALSIQQGDYQAMALEAHGIKGVSGNFSAMELMDLSKQLELAAKIGDSAEINVLWQQMQDAAKELESQLTVYVNNPK
ncbi:MAG: response regulator [Cellvibrionaceae bacterium]|nr:response regulator [Cellvibrionaceae bacterium]